MHLIFCLSLLLHGYYNQEASVTDSSGYEPPLAERIGQSDLVVEGEIVDIHGFAGNKGFTTALLKISRIFKGAVNDTTVEVVFAGAFTNGSYVIVSHGAGFSLEQSGIFFLKANNTHLTAHKTRKSFVMSFDRFGVLTYRQHGKHITRCNNFLFDNTGGLFARIESVTGQKATVLGPNLYERRAAKSEKQRPGKS